MTVLRPLVVKSSQVQQLDGADQLDVVRACDATAVSITSTILADVTGLSFVLEAGRTYVFYFDLSVTQTGLLATLGFAVNHSSTPLALFANVESGANSGSVNALLATVSLPIALGATIPVSVSGRIRTIGPGTMTLRGSRSAGTCTINGGGGSLIRV